MLLNAQPLMGWPVLTVLMAPALLMLLPADVKLLKAQQLMGWLGQC
jgi:hypothetical protein